MPQLWGVDVNASPNALYIGDEVVFYSGPGSLPTYVQIVGFKDKLVTVELPDGSHRLRPFGALYRPV